MKHTVEINDNTKAGKNLLEFLKDLSKNNKFISVTENETASLKDEELIAEIKKGLKSGLADKNSVLKKLGLK